MIDVLFAAIPCFVAFGAVGAASLSYLHCLPRASPEVVLVRAPFGFSKDTIRNEMKLREQEERFSQGPLYHLKFPIIDHA